MGYVSFRFEFKFGLAAVLALVHDVLVVLAAFSFTQRQLDSSFVAALLTIVGYSINDTIVIFDRIRENLKLHFRRGGGCFGLARGRARPAVGEHFIGGRVCRCLFGQRAPACAAARFPACGHAALA